MNNVNEKNFKMILEGFSKLSDVERINRLIMTGIFTQEDFLNLDKSINKEIAGNFVENLIGLFQLPIAVAVNYVIDNKDYIIPMVVEETSIIASASKTAKWIRDTGTITTKTLGWLGIGQIQIPKVNNLRNLKKDIKKHKKYLLEMVNKEIASRMVLRGGGAVDLQVRSIPRKDNSTMAIIHVLVNTCDAMGANTINQICEFLKPKIEFISQEKGGICILSNLVDSKLTRAEIILKDIDPILGVAIEEASLFGELDPYRAATSNKGMMNAIDGLLIATGNDWRAVEAGIHAYAAHSGQYKSITRWYMQGPDLHGECELPIDVGIVGGVTRLHPIAQMCLKILRIKTAPELARIVAAVGLVQNLAALKALTTVGITQGHMKLHINNLMMAYKIKKEERAIVEELLKARLLERRHITGVDISEVIASLRQKNT